MNKWEREVLGNRIDDEEKILKELRKSYQRALKDIDTKIVQLLGRLTTEEGEINKTSIEYQLGHQKALQADISLILDQMNTSQFKTISDYLEQCYQSGFIGTMYDCHHQGVPLVIPIDQKNVIKALKTNSKLSKGLWGDLADDNSELQNRIRREVARGLAQGSSYSKISKLLAEHMSIGYSKTARIVRTEGHRISQESTLDAQFKAKDKGADVVKQWDASLDGRTRKDHRKLDGQIRELDEPFEVGGHKAMCPGKFNRPEQDINCRCVILQRAKWALDEDELETLKERAKYFKLDKTESFVEFKEKYIESVAKIQEMEDNPVVIKEKIDQIKERIKKNGGKVTESDLQEAGKLVQEEFEKSKDSLVEIKKKKDEFGLKEKELRKELNEWVLEEREKVPGFHDLSASERWKIINEIYDSPEYKKREAELKTIESEIKKMKDQINDVEKKGLKTVLSRVRNIGMTEELENMFDGVIQIDDYYLSPQDKKWLKNNGLKRMKEVYSYYPTEWLEKSLKYNTIYLSKSPRGYYRHFDSGGSKLDVGRTGSLETIIHEMGHRFERVVPKIRELEKEFYERRTKGERLEWMGSGYGKDEVTRKDKFLNKYMGKDYGGTAYELVSMGFEMAFTEPNKLAKDPDYANFIYGILTLID